MAPYWSGQVADAPEIGNDAIHGEHAVGGNELQPGAGCVGGLELGFQIGHVVVLIAVPLGLAQADAVDDGGVVQLIADDSVLGGEHHFEQAAIGVEAGGVENGVFGAEETADGSLQLLMDGLGAADEADGGQTIAICIISGLGGFCQVPVIGQAQIVVGAHVQKILAVGKDVGALGGGDDPLCLQDTGLPNALQLGSVVGKCFLLVHNTASFLKISR